MVSVQMSGVSLMCDGETMRCCCCRVHIGSPAHRHWFGGTEAPGAVGVSANANADRDQRRQRGSTGVSWVVSFGVEWLELICQCPRACCRLREAAAILPVTTSTTAATPAVIP